MEKADKVVLKSKGKDSARNSSEENEVEEEKTYNEEFDVLGEGSCQFDPQDTEIDFVMAYRIRKIENLEQNINLKSLHLRKNQIRKIEGLDKNLLLEDLELYDNKIRVIENISHLKSLQILYLSFNLIREMACLCGFPFLKKIYLPSNKISKIEALYDLPLLEIQFSKFY